MKISSVGSQKLAKTYTQSVIKRLLYGRYKRETASLELKGRPKITVRFWVGPVFTTNQPKFNNSFVDFLIEQW